MAKEWVQDARNEARVEVHSCSETEKSLGALKQKHMELANKLTAAERARLSAKAGLMSVEIQAEDQRKQLHMTEIKLATRRRMVLNLKAELQKIKDAARVAREASEAMETASYERVVQETEVRLVEEVARVCRDYCAEVWVEALNQAGVSTDSELRKAENTFFPNDIREVLATLPPHVADPLPPSEQLSIVTP